MLFLLILAGGTVSGANVTWDGSGNGKWKAPTNWGGTAPVAGDSLFFAGNLGLTTNDNNFAAGTNFSGITFNSGAGAFTLNGFGITLGGNVTNNSTNLQTIALAMILSANRTFTTLTGGGDLTIGGLLSETGGAEGVIKAGVGTLTLSGVNTYTGVTTITAGTLSVGTIGNGGVAGNLGQATNAAANLVFDGGALQYTGVTASTNRNFTINTGKTAIFDITMNTLTLSGVSTATNGGLTKIGAGTLTLSGANTYTGATTVSAGVLNIQNSSALGSTTGGTSVLSGAALQLQGGITVGENLTLSGTGIANDGALRNISGTNTINGSITLNLATLFRSDAGTLALGGNVGNGGGGNSFTFDGGGDFSIAGVVSGDGALTKNGTGTLFLDGSNTYSGTTTINAGKLTMATDSGLGSISASLIINAGTLQVTGTSITGRSITLGSASSTIQVDASQSYTSTTAIGGTGTLNKDGAGTLVLSGANSYGGGTFINSGVVAINNSLSLGLTSGPLTINDGTLRVLTGFISARKIIVDNVASTIHVDAGQTYTVANSLSGTGGLTKNGTGTLVLNGADAHTGATTVNAGTLIAAASSGSALGSTSGITVNAGASLVLGASNQINDSASLTLAGGTFATAGFSEGSSGAAGIASLILTGAGSQIDFGTGATGTLAFALFNPGSNTIVIDNWTGVAGTAGGATSDRLIFATSQAANLNDFIFDGYYGATQIALAGGYYEVTPLTPVPEINPAFLSALCLFGGILLHRRCIRRHRHAARSTPA